LLAAAALISDPVRQRAKGRRMNEPFSIERVQTLRRLTRAVADVLGERVTAYLSTLTPLFRPRRVLGEHIRGAEKEPMKGADRAFREMQALFDSVARAQPFTLAREIKSPLEISSVALTIDPVEYRHEVRMGAETRVVTVRCPLAWTVSYSGYGPRVLIDLLAHRTGANEDLYEWLVHQLVLHAVVGNQPGLTEILGRLHFPMSVTNEPATGTLPITRIASPISTIRPPDDVIMKSVELSGMDAFEEVINVDDIGRMDDPLKDRLIEIARTHGEAAVA
jgi:hypothetical protein